MSAGSKSRAGSSARLTPITVSEPGQNTRPKRNAQLAIERPPSPHRPPLISRMFLARLATAEEPRDSFYSQRNWIPHQQTDCRHFRCSRKILARFFNLASNSMFTTSHKNPGLRLQLLPRSLSLLDGRGSCRAYKRAAYSSGIVIGTISVSPLCDAARKIKSRSVVPAHRDHKPDLLITSAFDQKPEQQSCGKSDAQRLIWIFADRAIGCFRALDSFVGDV